MISPDFDLAQKNCPLPRRQKKSLASCRRHRTLVDILWVIFEFIEPKDNCGHRHYHTIYRGSYAFKRSTRIQGRVLTASKNISRLPNGEKIRELRCLLGLTQRQLASRLECSERLIRKFEKSEFVSSKSLVLLSNFFNGQDLEVSLAGLTFSSLEPLNAGTRWFAKRLLEGDEDADQIWFSHCISLTPSTASKLEVLQGLAADSRITLGEALAFEQKVAIKFYIDRCDSSAVEDPDGCIWLTVVGDKINQLQLILDSEFDPNQKKSSA